MPVKGNSKSKPHKKAKKTCDEPHNEAKRACDQIFKQGGKVPRSARRHHNKRVKKELVEINCGTKLPGAYEGLHCVDPDGVSPNRIPKSKRFPLSEMAVHVDSSDKSPTQGVLLHGANEKGEQEFIAARVPLQNSRKMLKLKQEARPYFSKALDIKNDVGRGEKNGGTYDRYVIFGSRKCPRGTDVGKYSFRSNASDDDKKEVTQKIEKVVEALENISAPYISPKDRVSFQKLQQEIKLPSASEADTAYATQFSVGVNYWSPIHDDDDFFWTTLSVMDKNGTCDKHKVLHWFVFPEYNVAVPLCSGDILIFNPLVLHGCTNHTEMDTFIFSAYVSAKTVAARGANAL